MRAIAILLLLALPAHAEVVPGCQSAMEQALSGYAGCRLLALSKDTRRPDAAKLSDSLSTCAMRFEAAMYKALGRYGMSACPDTPLEEFKAYVDTFADTASAATSGDTLPDLGPCLPTPEPTPSPVPTATPEPTPTPDPTPTPACTPYAVEHSRGGTYTNNCDGTVTDSSTGLVWELKDPGPGVHGYFNTYTWSSSSSNGNFTGTAKTEFLDELNCTGAFGANWCAPFARHTGWRMPTKDELLTIAQDIRGWCQTYPVCTPPVFGPTTAPLYWSGTTGSSPLEAWIVAFISGYGFGETTRNKIEYRSVRAVRTGP